MRQTRNRILMLQLQRLIDFSQLLMWKICSCVSHEFCFSICQLDGEFHSLNPERSPMRSSNVNSSLWDWGIAAVCIDAIVFHHDYLFGLCGSYNIGRLCSLLLPPLTLMLLIWLSCIGLAIAANRIATESVAP